MLPWIELVCPCLTCCPYEMLHGLLMEGDVLPAMICPCPYFSDVFVMLLINTWMVITKIHTDYMLQRIDGPTCKLIM